MKTQTRKGESNSEHVKKKAEKNESVKQVLWEWTKGNGNNFSAGEQSMHHLRALRYGFNSWYFGIKGNEFQSEFGFSCLRHIALVLYIYTGERGW